MNPVSQRPVSGFTEISEGQNEREKEKSLKADGCCFIPPVFPAELCRGPERAAPPAALLHACLSGAFNKSHVHPA